MAQTSQIKLRSTFTAENVVKVDCLENDIFKFSIEFENYKDCLHVSKVENIFMNRKRFNFIVKNIASSLGHKIVTTNTDNKTVSKILISLGWFFKSSQNEYCLEV